MKLQGFIDGGSRGNPGPGASAAVLRDATGKTVSAEGLFLGTCTNNHAEYTALSLIIGNAVKLGATELELFSDSLLLVNQFNGIYKIKNPHLAEMMAEIKKKARGLRAITLTHVRREKNKEADALVNKTLDEAAKNGLKKPQPKKETGGGFEQLSLF